jgi:hypothetical protein
MGTLENQQSQMPPLYQPKNVFNCNRLKFCLLTLAKGNPNDYKNNDGSETTTP